MASLCLIVPCYNEEKRLPIETFGQFLTENKDVSILFVNDGSSDKTEQVLESLCDKYENANFHSLSRNSGKAEAVRVGVTLVKDHEYFGYWDADLATPLHSIPLFMEQFTDKIELVMGSRIRRLGSYIERYVWRHYFGRVFATCASLVLQLPVYDTQCGAKIFRNTPIMQQVFSQSFLSRWLFDVEILARLRTHYRAEEILDKAYELPLPVWKDIGASKVQSKDFIRSIADLWKIARKYRKAYLA